MPHLAPHEFGPVAAYEKLVRDTCAQANEAYNTARDKAIAAAFGTKDMIAQASLLEKQIAACVSAGDVAGTEELERTKFRLSLIHI